MKLTKIKVFLTLLIVFSLAKTWGNSTKSNEISPELQLRAANEKVVLLLNELRNFKQKSVPLLPNSSDDAFNNPILSSTTMAVPGRNCNPTTNCVSNCVGRYNNGQCYSFGKDFCAPNAACVPQCSGRYNNGECYSYKPDYCAVEASCAPNCLGRYNNGTCYSYGPDVCY